MPDKAGNVGPSVVKKEPRRYPWWVEALLWLAGAVLLVAGYYLLNVRR